MDKLLQLEIERLVADISAGRWDEIARDGRIGNNSILSLSKSVLDYGKTISSIPDDGWKLVNIIQSSVDDSLLLDVPLWTMEEGRSDLTLLLDVNHIDGKFDIKIEDIHVL